MFAIFTWYLEMNINRMGSVSVGGYSVSDGFSLLVMVLEDFANPSVKLYKMHKLASFLALRSYLVFNTETQQSGFESDFQFS